MGASWAANNHLTTCHYEIARLHGFFENLQEAFSFQMGIRSEIFVLPCRFAVSHIGFRSPALTNGFIKWFS